MIDGEVDPHKYFGEPLWCVYGNDCFPEIIACKVTNHPDSGPTIWGYSVYKRSPGYRTLGIRLSEFNPDTAKFFNYQPMAIAYISSLVTPKIKKD